MSFLSIFQVSCPCISRDEKTRSPWEPDGTVAPGRRGGYLAGFKGNFPAVASEVELLEAPVRDAVESVAKRNKDLASYLFNDVKVCPQCGRPCAWTQKNCQGCGSNIVDVSISQTENVMMGFIFGLERTARGMGLTISLRRETDRVMVFDDLLAMSSCHFNALLTSHYCQDWRWLLRDPKLAKSILQEFEREAWQATVTFLQQEKWRKFVYREGVTEDMVRKNIICGFNSPPSQYQLHMQWIVLPLMPFHHQKLLEGTHAMHGRFFPLQYVKEILDQLDDAGETYDVNALTPPQEIIEYFNSKGIYYDRVWKENHQRYCDSYKLSNWRPEDFSYIVVDGVGHRIQKVLAGGTVLPGDEVDVDLVSTQTQDKLQLQNYGRRIGSNGTPGGTHYKHHKEIKIGKGGILIWQGLEKK